MGGSFYVTLMGFFTVYFLTTRFLLSLCLQKVLKFRDFPGGAVVKNLPANAGDTGSIPVQGAKIPHGPWPKKPKHKTGAIL